MYFFFFFPVGTDARLSRPPLATLCLVTWMLGIYAIRHFDPVFYDGLLRLAFRPSEPGFARAILSIFLHGSWMHVVQNTLYLWIFGRQLEGRAGLVPLLLILLPSGILSCWIQLWATPVDSIRYHAPLVGASGAVAALLGATLVRFRHQRVRILYFLFAFLGGMNKGGVVYVNTVLACLFWFGMQIVYGLVNWDGGSSVAYAAHAGGFGAGLVSAFLLGMPGDLKREVHLERGRRHFESGDWFAAVGELSQHLEIAPEDDAARRMRARCHLLLGQTGEAASEYLALLARARRARDLDRVARLYREMTRYGIATNLSEPALLKLAYELRRAGYPDGAADALFETATRFPAGPKAEIALIRRAEILWTELGRVDEALAGYRRVLETFPRSEWRDLCEARIRSIDTLAGRALAAGTSGGAVTTS